jgi:hypothetical protein
MRRALRLALLTATATATAAPASASHIPFDDPLLPEQVTCGTDPFPLDALRGPKGVERRRGSVYAALRRHIREEERLGPDFPNRNFRLLARTKRRAVFAAGHPPRMGYVLIVRERSGWDVETFGDCLRLRAVGASGSAATWRLDPAAPAPTPESTEIPILVHERECASGEPATGRIADPQVRADANRIVVPVFVRPVEGGAECPGNPDTPYVLRLPEPLGDRALLDGGLVPLRKRFPR